MSYKEYITFRGKTVGWIVFDTYHTRRTPDTFFIKYHSFGISEELLFMLKKKGVKTVVVHYEGKEGLALFIAPIDKFFEGRVWYDGDDKQYHLHTKDMTCLMPKPVYQKLIHESGES